MLDMCMAIDCQTIRHFQCSTIESYYFLMIQLKCIIEKYSTGRNVLLLFLLTNVVYLVMLLGTIPLTMAFANNMRLLDMIPWGYSTQYINALFKALGPDGRNAYLYRQLPIDMIYPFLFCITYALMAGYFLKNIQKLKSRLFFICILPAIAGVADYAENFGIIAMLNSYPALNPVLANTTSYFSIIKSMTTTLFFIALIAIMFMFGYKKLTTKRTA